MFRRFYKERATWMLFRRQDESWGTIHPVLKPSPLITGHPIESKRCWCRVGAVIPGPIEARFRTQRLACRDGRVIRKVGNRDITATLGITAIPELRNRLSISERELQTPAVNRGCARVGNGKGCAKATRPLAGDGVMDATVCAGCLCAGGRRGRCYATSRSSGWCIRRRGGWRCAAGWCGSRNHSSGQGNQMRFEARAEGRGSTTVITDQRRETTTVIGVPGPAQVANPFLVKPGHGRVNEVMGAIALSEFARDDRDFGGHRCDL